MAHEIDMKSHLTFRYKHWSKNHYVPLMTLPAVVYGLAMWIYGLSRTSNEDYIFFCDIPTALHGRALTIGLVSNLLICLFVTVAYTVAYVSARRLGARRSTCTEYLEILHAGFGGESNSQAEQQKQYMLQSLMLVMLVYTVCWFSILIAYAIITRPSLGMAMSTFSTTALLAALTGEQIAYCGVYLSYGSALNNACNGYIYAWRSTEYRQAFKKVCKSQFDHVHLRFS